MLKYSSFDEFINACYSICLSRIKSKKENKILSIGCNGNWYPKWFQRFFPAKIKSHICISHYLPPSDLESNVKWIQQDIIDLSNINRDDFDIIFISSTFDKFNIEQQAKLLYDLNKILNEDNICIVTGFNYEITNQYGLQINESKNQLTANQVMEIVHYSGFNIIDKKGIIPSDLVKYEVNRELKYVKPFDINKIDMDISKCISDNVNKAFIWWFVFNNKKDLVGNIKIKEKLQKYQVENKKNKKSLVYHIIGELIEKDNQYKVKVSPKDGPGVALYGPFKFYPPRKYKVSFNICISKEDIISVNRECNVCIIDVASDGGRNTIAKKVITYTDLLKDNNFILDFNLQRKASLEFRVHYLGCIPIEISITPIVFYEEKENLELLSQAEGQVSYSQCGEDLIVSYIFQQLNKSNFTYLDIGAHHPKILSNTYSFYKSGIRGVCVEPDPYLYKIFKEERPEDICLNIGVGVSNKKEADFYIMSEKGINTFSKDEAEKIESQGKYFIEKIIKIPLININEVIEKYFDNGPDFISLDVEGLDFEILKTFNFEKYKPDVFCIETIEYDNKGKGKKRTKIIEYMKQKGYSVYADTYINTIFVKSN
jgi:FkbM family methyltransferase